MRRASYIKEVNAALLQAFGPRDRLRSEALEVLYAHVKRYYPA
jgi:hypothetical protein